MRCVKGYFDLSLGKIAHRIHAILSRIYSVPMLSLSMGGNMMNSYSPP